MADLPARGTDLRRLGLTLPPERMPLWRRGRLLKRWRYVGVYGPELMLCVGDAHIGPIRQRWWAVAEPGGRLHQDSSLRSAGVAIDGSRVRVDRGAVEIALDLEENEGVETASPIGERGNYIWTRKQADIPVRGHVTLDGRRHEIDGGAFIDDSAGYHLRHTVWKWSAGIGRGERGEHLAWNFVTGVHDSDGASERTVWVDGEPAEAGPVEFADDLSAVGGLRFEEWSAREERMNVLLLRSTYRQPFGRFSGELPGGVRLADGFGVMEEHDVWW